MASPMHATLIGCGPLGRRYAEAAAGLAPLAMRRFADADTSRAQQLADEFGGAVVDVHAALADSAGGVVIVTDSLAVAALDGSDATPKAWLLAPPLGMTVSTVRARMRTLRDSGAPVMFGLTMRFEPLVRLTRALLPRPSFLHGEMLRPESLTGEPDGADTALWQLAPAAFDLVCHLMDGTPRQIHLEGGALLRPGAGVDSAACALAFAEGRTASILVAAAGRPAATGGWAVEVTDGARRVALWDEGRAADLAGFERADIERHLPDGVRCTWEADGVCRAHTTAAAVPTVTAQLAAVAALAGGGPAPPYAAGLDDGVRASALVLSGLASLRRGEPSAMARV